MGVAQPPHGLRESGWFGQKKKKKVRLDVSNFYIVFKNHVKSIYF
jgi:hypothetical protein